jgi:transcriptional regulator PpsR
MNGRLIHMAPHPNVQPDITLLLDMDGVIREATLSPSMVSESVDGWLGRPWVEVAGDGGGDKIRRMVDDARQSGISAFRQINQRFPSGLELPMEFTTVLLGGRAGMLAIGKNLQAVAELQSRLIAAQQTMERDYWKLREIETRYRLVFDASDEAVLIVSTANLRIIEANRAAVEALSSPRRRNEDLAGRELLPDVAMEDREAVREMLARVRDRGKALSILVHIGAEARPWMLRGSLIAAEPGHAFMLQFTAAAHAPIPHANGVSSIVEELIDRLPDSFVALDDAGIVTHANQAFLDLVQVGTKGSVIGESLSRWLWQPGADLNALQSNVQRHGMVRLFTTTIRGELGSDTEVEISAAHSEQDGRRSIGVMLRNVSRRLPAHGDGDTLRAALGSVSEQIGKSSLRKLVKNTVSIVEQHYVKEALELAKGNRTATAELLGLSRQSLYAKLGRYGLDDKGPGAEETSED